MENDNNTKALAAGVYKYVYNNEVIYIGMSKRDIFDRINAHSREEKFKPYLKDCEIFVYIMNHVENKCLIKMFETGLIDQYCPILNSTERPSKPYGSNFEDIFNIDFQPLDKAKEEYYRTTDTVCADKDSKKSARKLSNIDKKISRMEEVVERNERAFKYYLTVMKEITEGNYTPIERNGRHYKELVVSEIDNIGTSGICREGFRRNNLGLHFEIRHNETEEGLIFCIIEDDFLRDDSLTPFLENIQISKNYLYELRVERDNIKNNLDD